MVIIIIYNLININKDTNPGFRVVEFIRYNGNGQDDIIMQPIWEFFYKNVIGQSTTLTRKDSPGLDFEEGENFWDSIVNVKVVANLFFYVYSHFFFF